MSAARHADVLFVKNEVNNDLHEYCVQEGIKHILFKRFDEALPIVQSVVDGKKMAAEVLA